MAVLSSLFQKHKCSRVYGDDRKYCVYFVDILLCAVIVLLLIPQILVVSVTGEWTQAGYGWPDDRVGSPAYLLASWPFTGKVIRGKVIVQRSVFAFWCKMCHRGLRDSDLTPHPVRECIELHVVLSQRLIIGGADVARCQCVLHKSTASSDCHFLFEFHFLPPFQAYWYRRGELEPKFRTMIYYNAVVTVLLCISANMYFLQVGIDQ